MSLYRGMNRGELDAAYNNTLAVADSARLLADFDLRSEQLRRERATALDLRYGRAPRNRLDYFAGEPGAPLVVFIHGGYWQMRAKESFSFVAAGPLAHGLHVAVIGYTLAPETSLAGIVSEVRSALAWLAERAPGYGAAAPRIYVAGWSAGGHLTAMCLREPTVRGGLAISGIFDLEPVRLSYLNDQLELTAKDARRLSPLHQLSAAPLPLMIGYGGAELPELQRQSRDYAAARAAARLPGRALCLDGHNHFTILDELARPDGALTALLLELVLAT